MAHGNLTWDAGRKLYFNDPGNDPSRREWFNRQCCKVFPNGALNCDWFGDICPPDKPCPSPSPVVTPPASPTPQPGPTPGTCPPLVRWGGGLHAQMTPQHQGLPKVPTFAGNTIDFDSTARFGNQAGGRGSPCNDEHHAVCDAQGQDQGPNWRRCEDPRGPIWTNLSCGGAKFKTINGGWGYRIEGVHAGRCCVRICPREDMQDGEGQPVRVLGNACTEACADVQ